MPAKKLKVQQMSIRIEADTFKKMQIFCTLSEESQTSFISRAIEKLMELEMTEEAREIVDKLQSIQFKKNEKLT